MRLLGIFIDSFKNDATTIAMINSLNQLIKEGIAVTLFYSSWNPPPVQPEFSILFKNEIFSYKGPIIATNMSNACVILSAYSVSARYLYLLDLEWHKDNRHFGYNKAVLNDNRFKYITNSKEDQKIFKNVWNRNSSTMENFDYKEMRKLCL